MVSWFECLAVSTYSTSGVTETRDSVFNSTIQCNKAGQYTRRQGVYAGNNGRGEAGLAALHGTDIHANA